MNPACERKLSFKVINNIRLSVLAILDIFEGHPYIYENRESEMLGYYDEE